MRRKERHVGGLERPRGGKVLVLAAHVGDAVKGCGGTLALHADQGDSVYVLNLADEELRLIHGDALAASSACLAGAAGGIQQGYLWSDLSEPFNESRVAQLADGIMSVLDEWTPASIYLPWNGERDERSSVLRRALEFLQSARSSQGLPGDPEIWGYEVNAPLVARRVLDVTPVMPRKVAAMSCHVTHLTAPGLLHQLRGLAAFRSSHLSQEGRYAEAFTLDFGKDETRPGRRRSAA